MDQCKPKRSPKSASRKSVAKYTKAANNDSTENFFQFLAAENNETFVQPSSKNIAKPTPSTYASTEATLL